MEQVSLERIEECRKCQRCDNMEIGHTGGVTPRKLLVVQALSQNGPNEFRNRFTVVVATIIALTTTIYCGWETGLFYWVAIMMIWKGCFTFGDTSFIIADNIIIQKNNIIGRRRRRFYQFGEWMMMECCGISSSSTIGPSFPLEFQFPCKRINRGRDDEKFHQLLDSLFGAKLRPGDVG